MEQFCGHFMKQNYSENNRMETSSPNSRLLILRVKYFTLFLKIPYNYSQKSSLHRVQAEFYSIEAILLYLFSVSLIFSDRYCINTHCYGNRCVYHISQGCTWPVFYSWNNSFNCPTSILAICAEIKPNI